MSQSLAVESNQNWPKIEVQSEVEVALQEALENDSLMEVMEQLEEEFLLILAKNQVVR